MNAKKFVISIILLSVILLLNSPTLHASGLQYYFERISILSFTATKNTFDASEDTGYTDISFTIDDTADVSIVVLDIGDLIVRTLIDNINFLPGIYNNVCTWDGKDETGRLVLPGEYTLRMTAQDAYENVDEAEIPITIKGTLLESYQISGEWEKENSPYVICGTEAVRNIDFNDTLQIAPGVRVMFWPHDEKYRLLVQGVIEARGIEEDSILISSYRKSWERENGDWAYFRTVGVLSKVLFKYCTIEFGGDTLYSYPAHLWIESSEADTVRYCTIRNSAGHGLYSENELCVIDSNVFTQNDSFPLVVEASVVKNLVNNVYEDNAVEEICIRGEGHVEENAIWLNPGIPYRIQTVLSVYNNPTDTCTLTIEKGNILKFSQNTGLNIGSDYGYGMLSAEGTKDEPIVFTAVNSSEYWNEIYFHTQASDSSILRNCELSFGIRNIRCYNSSPRIDSCFIRSPGQTGIYYWHCSPRITNCTISENRIGIDCYPYISSDPIIYNCNIVGNTEYGVKNNSTAYTIDAYTCWWGSSTGPYDPSIGFPDHNPDGLGDKVSDYVYYRPWLESGPYPLIVTGFIFTGDGISPVINPEVTVMNLNTDSEWVATVEPDTNEYYLKLNGPGLPNVNDILRITAKKTLDDGGTYDPAGYTYTINISDTTVTQATIDNGEIELDLYLNHYCINYYPDYPYHTQNNWNYSGAAVMQMWTDFKDVEPPYSQEELHTMGIANNTEADRTAGLEHIDPQGMAETLKDIITNLPPGHTFTVGAMPGDEDGLNWAMHRICWWHYTGPGALPTGGDYTHWMSVRGIHTDKRPQDGRYGGYQGDWEYDVYGFWINDPDNSPASLGANSYKTASEWTSTYYTIITDPYNESWNGKYITVLEPPEYDAMINIVSPKQRFNNQQITEIRRIVEHDDIPKHIEKWIVQAAIDGVTDELIPFDEGFKTLFKTTIPGTPIFVKNTYGNDYFAVPFNSTAKTRDISKVNPILEAKPISRTEPITAFTSFLKSEPILQDNSISDTILISRRKSIEKYKTISKHVSSVAKAQTVIVVLLNAEDGSFKEVSWTDTPIKYLPISRKAAQLIAFEFAQELGLPVGDANDLHPELIHKNSTLYYPYWRVVIENHEIYISQDGKVWEGEEDRGVGGGTMSSGGVPTPFIYSLKPVSPNPFANNAVINFSIAKPGEVSLKIYDISGRLVKTIIHEKKDAGVYTARWNGYNNSDRKAAIGVYFTRLTSGNFTSVKKVVFLGQ